MLGAGALLLGGTLAGCNEDIPENAVQELPTPRLGEAGAPATIQLFEDYADPNCADFTREVTPRLVENYVSSGATTLEVYDFPLPVTEFSWPAAMGARSVQDRGSVQQFYDYGESLFLNQSSLDWALLSEAANAIGIDGGSVVADAQNSMYRPVVNADKQYGTSIGVSATPTVLVNDQQVEPPGSSYDEYYRAIADAVEHAQ